MTKTIWKKYWQNYRGVTKFGAWSQKQALKKVFWIIKEEDIKKDIKIIDIGCGEGRTLKAFRKWGFKNSFGIDNTQESLALCQKNGLKLNKDVFMADVRKTKFRNKNYNLVFSEGLLEHYQNPKPIIKEMARISSKYILLVQPNHYSFVGNVIAVLGPRLRNNVKEFTFSKKYFINQFKNFGFFLKAEKYTPLREFFILLFKDSLFG